VKRRNTARAVVLSGAMLVGAIVTIAVRGADIPAAPASLGVITATVVRTNLSSTVLTGGTLDYAASAPVVNHLAGTYTWLQPTNGEVAPAGVLYRIDNAPTVLLAGSLPAWRPFAAGMTDGPDVKELEANLIVLGSAHGLFSSPTDHFTSLTAVAVKRWQAAIGLPVTGTVGLGSVVFLPGAIRIKSQLAALGQPATPGDQPYQVTTTTRDVAVSLNEQLPTVTPGQPVSIILPSGTSTPGHATAIETIPSNGSGNGSAPSSSTDLIVTPDVPSATGTATAVPVQVSLTARSVHNVLAAPIPALLALEGGGYGVEVISRAGGHRLIGVHTGLFAGGQVEISGPDVHQGLRVVVSQ
jgi:peptidoglycan hydrolase-like protein with peptidoglycan-binding domain